MWLLDTSVCILLINENAAVVETDPLADLGGAGCCGLVAVPVLSVLSSIFQPGQGNWPHLVETVLPHYITNSLILMAGVSVGVVIAGVGPAWLVVMCEFPGRRLFEWTLILPLAVPAYVVAYAYTDFLQAAGPLQTWMRDMTGWGVRDYWFPQVRSLEGADRRLFRSVDALYLSACSYRFSGAIHQRAGGRLNPGEIAVEPIPHRRGPVGSPCHRRRDGAGPDGNPGRLRHGRAFRHQHVHDRYLQDLVLHGRPRGGRPAFEHPRGLRVRVAAARAL